MQTSSWATTFRLVLWASCALFLLWFLASSGIVTGVLLFFMAGVVPGTSISLSPIAMWALFAIVALGVIRWLHREQLGKQIKAMKAEHNTKLASSAKKPATQRPKARRSRPTAAARPAKNAGARRSRRS